MAKKRNEKNRRTLFAFVSAIALLSSCAIDISLEVPDDFSCMANFSSNADGDVEAAIDGVLQLTKAKAMFDPSEIEKTLVAAGKTDVSVKNESLCKLDVKFKSRAVEDVLGFGTSLIKCAKDRSLVEVKISPETAKECLAILPEDSKPIIDLLMAPIFTGENFAEKEYCDDIALIYGEKMAKALKAASVKFRLRMPRNIAAAKISRDDFGFVETKANIATFTFPLVKILCLQDSVTLLLLLE